MTPYLWGMLSAIGVGLGVLVWLLIRKRLGGSIGRTPRWRSMLFCGGAVTFISLVGLTDPQRQTRALIMLPIGVVMMLIAVFIIKPRDERTV